MTLRGPVWEPKARWGEGGGTSERQVDPRAARGDGHRPAGLGSRDLPGASGSGCNGAPWRPPLRAQLVPAQ